MSAYNYPPPPPPPSHAMPQYLPHDHAQNGFGGPARGQGGHQSVRGRGSSQRGRDTYGPPHVQPGNGYGPPQHGGAYPPQNAPYIGPQAPSQHNSGFQPPSWNSGPSPQMQQHNHAPPPNPIPLSAQNYHPNYAPQVYQQPQPQGPPTMPHYGPQQPSYPLPTNTAPYNTQAQPYTPYGQNGPSPPQWQQAAPQANRPQYDAGRGGGNGNRGRGPSSRGGYAAPVVLPPVRIGFGGPNEPPPPAIASYSEQYPTNHRSPPGPQYASPRPQSAQNYNLPPMPPASQYDNQGRDDRSFHGNDRGSFRGGHDRGRGRDNYRGRGGRDRDSGFRNNGYRDRDRDRDRDHRDNFNSNRDRGFKQARMPPRPTVKPAPDAMQTDKPAMQSGDKVNGDGKKKKKKKRKTNTLGLTPAGEDHIESEEEDDVDEESRLAAAVTGASILLPGGATDLSAWLQERRQRFPTKARREAKAAEAAKRRATDAEEFARAKAQLQKDRDDATAAAKQDHAAAVAAKKLRKIEKLRRELAALEASENTTTAGSKRKRESNDSGDEDSILKEETVKEEGDPIDQVIANVTVKGAVSPSEQTVDFSDDSSSSDSDDEPESQSTRLKGPVKIIQPPKPTIQRQCKYFSTGGTCGKKGKCRFIHDEAVRNAALKEKAKDGRMSLSQRMLQNDQEKDDLIILKSIKSLHEKGLLDDPHPDNGNGNESIENSNIDTT